MARTFLQPGFRFHPTDVELVMFYLKRKVTRRSLRFEAIRELDLYKFAPWELPDKSCLQTGDLEWYFFCARDKKYSNGMRANRATEIGYWKTTGRDRPVHYKSQTVGMKKTLVFHIGRAPQGERTNWVMHEYRLQDKALVDVSISQDSFVLCRVFQKSGAGPKNGEQYGAPFREEDWEDDLLSNLEASTAADSGLPVVPLVDAQNSLMTNGGFIVGDVSGSSSEPVPCHNASEKHPLVEDGDIGPSLAGLREEDLPHQIGNGNSKKPDMSSIESTVDSPIAEDADDIFNGLEDLSSTGELKKADIIDLPSLGSKYARSQMLLKDDGSYMELYDLDSPVDLPFKANAPEQRPYMDIGTCFELELVNKSKSPNYVVDELYTNQALLEVDGAYVELKDLSSVTVPVKSDDPCSILSSNLKMKAVDDFHVSSSPGNNFLMDQVLEDDRSFMELNDLTDPLVCPMEASGSNQVLSKDLHNCCHDAGDLKFFSKQSYLPFNEVDKSIGGPSASGNEGSFQNSGAHLVRVAEETLISEELVRGEQQMAYSRPQSLLDSIPARPASAAEHPSINGGKGSKASSGLFGYCDGFSAIHFKAEVKVGCRCTGEPFSIKLGKLSSCSSSSCTCYHTRELRKEAVTWGRGFTFVVLLGMVTALFWAVVLVVSVKLSFYTWKLVLS